MGALTEVLQAWAAENITAPNLQIKEEGDRATLKYNAQGDSEDFSYTAFLEVKESSSLFQLFIYPPVKIPLPRVQAAAEAVTRLNHDFLLGYLDLDLADGELRYYHAMAFMDGTLSPAMIERLHGAGIQALEKGLPILMAIGYANATPEEAIARAQGEAPPLPVPETTPSPPWERIPGADLLQGWAGELKAALATQDASEWQFAGQALVLVAAEWAGCAPALSRVAAEAGFAFVNVPADQVMALPDPQVLRSLAPVIVYLEPGRWCLGKQEDEPPELTQEVEGFQQRLAAGLRAFSPAKPVVVVTANVKLGDLSLILDGPERFDRYLSLPAPSLALRSAAFLDELGRERCGASLLDNPGKVGKLIIGGPNNASWRRLAVLYLQRLHRRTGRAVEFIDLMHLSTRGFAETGNQPEEESPAQRRQTAVHEAGHAAVAILDSQGDNIPDYCSIVPGADFKGVVAESVAYHQSRDAQLTYRDMRHRIRISLAGRAAEELVFGTEEVSSGASQDLESCYDTAMQAFCRFGFAPDMGAPGASASNLAVVVGKPTASEYAHNEALVRRFLASEYAATLTLLASQRPLLEAISDRLMWDPIVDQDELKQLCQENNVAPCRTP